jgi:hypothetical protein
MCRLISPIHFTPKRSEPSSPHRLYEHETTMWLLHRLQSVS